MIHMWALYAREVKRFCKLWLDTVFSPIVSVGLYLAVFGVIAGNRVIGNTHYVSFMYAGLLAMLLVNSSFSNPAFALIISKNVGTIVDLQLVPIKPWKIGIAYALAALTRAVITLLIALLLTVWFVQIRGISHPLMLLASIGVTGLEFGMLGVIFGIRAKNFEALTFMTTFIMQPMIFLAGVFYPLAALPHPWSDVSAWNPLHHTINLFRYGLIGYADTSPRLSFGVTLAIGILLFVMMQVMTRKNISSTQ